MPTQTLQFLFRLSVIAFLVGGSVIVVVQALGIALGDVGWVTAVEEHAGPPTFIVSSVSGLLAFVLSYLTKPEESAEVTSAARDRKPTAAPGAG
ncbi:hypothetical protein [Streptomyces mirabilis]|uniref:hypothetical protein n=1 Tax=Streptomyces mirabilis TaxID=68239 RepID=UPI0033A42173